MIVTFCFGGELSLMFWNVENLFDVEDEPAKQDGDFLPGGAKRYTYRSYCLKIQHLSDVINRVHPDLLAMVEVENRYVLLDLKTELRDEDYWEILIDEGNDIRGIDPALMFRNDRFVYIRHLYYPVFIKERGYHSRPIMRVDLAVLNSADTLSVFINHWPSRRGGKMVSDPFRNFAAGILLQSVKTTLAEHPRYGIVMTGDFNDDRQDECLNILCSDMRIKYLEKERPQGVKGTYCHQGDWIQFDHYLCANIDETHLKILNTRIIAPHWIRDNTTNGPLRFYEGMTILGGYSDHFPILLKLGFKRKIVE